MKLILWVEDDRSVITVAWNVLHEEADLVFATSVSEARRKLASRLYDLVVMDLMLPDGNGIDVIRDLKAVRPEQQIIAVTAAATDLITRQAIEAGAAAVLPKTHRLERVLDYL